MRIFGYVQWLAACAAVALVAACGGGGGDGPCVTDPNRDPRLPGCGTTSAVKSVELLVASQQLPSDGASTVLVTVIALDANRAGVQGRPVTLSASDPAGAAFLSNFSGASGSRATDANGQLTATLATGGNRSNRAIGLSANVDGVTASNTVNVVGTTLSMTGSGALGLNATAGLGFALADSSGAPIAGATITVTSASGNPIAPASIVTDANGKAAATVTGAKAGSDTITAAAMGASASLAINVSSTSFTFTTPAPGVAKQVSVNVAQPLVVRWTDGGSPVTGAAVGFATTRGTLSASQATTLANGEASVTVSSQFPGPATVTASAGGGVVATVNLVFVTTGAPAKIDLQADRTTLPTNPTGTATNVANLYATVRDSLDNPAAGATVNFHIDQDTTGGALTVGVTTTDVNGIARTQYVPTAVSSPTNGVVIRATLLDKTGNAVDYRTVALTVGGQKLFVRIGTDNYIESVDANYVKKWSAFVTDAAGNPVPGASVQFLLRARQDVAFDPAKTGDAAYVRRFLLRDTNPPEGIPPSLDYAYRKGTSVWNGSIWEAAVSANCFNEDVNFNGIQDPGEDLDFDGKLDPGNAFSVPGTVATNASGYATAEISYPKDRARWTTVTLKATARVAGTEAIDQSTFALPIALQDVSVQFGSPPGRNSPYGVSGSCADPN